MWMEFWDGNINGIGATNSKFREWKIQQKLMDRFEEFVELLFLDEEDFVKTYFVQEFHTRYILELHNILNVITPFQLYSFHQKYPLVRLEYAAGVS
ncbi:hypothetical protein D3C74_277750 [compost metagenome]